MTDLQIHTSSEKIDDDLDKTRLLLRNRNAANTRKSYQSDWRNFVIWCDERGLESMPASPDTVALFVGSISDKYKPSTISRHISSISRAHKDMRHDSPALRSKEPLHSVWTSILRTYNMRKDKKTALLIDDIRMMVEFCDSDDLRATRNRAILLLGWAGGMRRSEVCNLHFDDVEYLPEGMTVLIRRGKRDQEGVGLKKGIVYGEYDLTCPVKNLRTWIKESGLRSGPIFRAIDRHGNISDKQMTGRSIARIVKEFCFLIGLDESLYSAHSLRSGFATQAAKSGVIERKIMRHTGHKSEQSVREYIQEGNLFEDNPTARLGL